MRIYPIEKIKLATLVARAASKRWKKQHCWVLSGWQKRVETQKDLGDPILFVGFNYELPARFKDTIACFLNGKSMPLE